MKKFTLYLLIVPVVAILNSCSKSSMDDVDPCANPPTVTLKTMATVTGKSTGSIEASANGGTAPLILSIDGRVSSPVHVFQPGGRQLYCYRERRQRLHGQCHGYRHRSTGSELFPGHQADH